MRRILILIFLLGATAACQANEDEPAAPASAAGSGESVASGTDAQIALGIEVYQTHCAECHGANLEGEPNWKEPNPDGTFRAPPHDETGHTWHHGDRQLIEAILYGGERLPDNIGGASEMPAYEEVLTLEEIEAVLAYFKSSWPENIREAQAARTEAEGASAP